MTKILVVDDTELSLQLLEEMLIPEGYDVVMTTSPQQALSMVLQDTYAVVISDQFMPCMDGIELLDKMHQLAPQTIRIMLTGQPDVRIASAAINQAGIYRFLTKPCNRQTLCQAVKEAVNEYGHYQENQRVHATSELALAKLHAQNVTLEQLIAEKSSQITDLHEVLQTTFRDEVQVLIEMIEKHSGLVGSHSKRVAAISRALAKCFQLSEGFMFQLDVAASLHDIGKISIDPKMLAKPVNQITPEERLILQQHSIQGQTLLSMVPHFEQAALMVRHHHEAFDGTGYPDKLRGESISLGARIIHVADMYDKILHHRDNYQSMTPQKAFQRIFSLSATMFDPDVVNALHKTLEAGFGWGLSEEIEIYVRDLRPGMVLSRNVVSQRGVLLLSKDCKISEAQFARIKDFLERENTTNSIFVYRSELGELAC